MELALSKSSRCSFCGSVFHCMISAAPRHRSTCSSWAGIPNAQHVLSIYGGDRPALFEPTSDARLRKTQAKKLGLLGDPTSPLDSPRIGSTGFFAFTAGKYRPSRLLGPRCFLLCVRSGLGVSVRDPAGDYIAITGHDFPIPAEAVLHNSRLIRVIHGCIPCRTRGSATGLSATDACRRDRRCFDVDPRGPWSLFNWEHEWGRRSNY